jgi:hypothetical protein
MKGEFIERRIVTGLIVSNDFMRRIARFWEDTFLESPEFQKIARWCLDHFDKYEKVPDRDIEMIYIDNLQKGSLSKAEGEIIEEILTRISDDYERGDLFNSGYLFDRATAYFRHRDQIELRDRYDDLVDAGDVERADELLRSYAPKSFVTTIGLEVGSEEGYKAIEEAFSIVSQPVVKYPGPIGQMMNPHLIRGGFVAFLAPEKRGKTWYMMDIALRALRQQANVAFFQAGDLTQAQMLRRMCIYFSRRSDDPAYCKPRYRAVGDCIRNQFDVCKRKDRNCAFGIYDDEMDRFIAEPHEFEKLSNLIEKAQEFDDYRPCDSHGCKDRQATVWVVEEPEKEPLTGKEAVDFARAFFTKWKRRFKLHCAPSGSLSTEDMRRVLDEWENQDDFVPDVIVTDYADIMASPEREYRHKQDGIWRGLRGISQERHSLVITATQADARSYGQSILNLSNFSEDKRKYAHVTAMFGLNQDPKGREKQLGILRVNELLVREGIFNSNNDVVVLQDLGSGRPFTESYAPVRI